MQPRTRREQLLPNSGLGAVNAVQSPAHAQEWLDFIKLINLFRPLAAPRGWGGLEVCKLSLCLNPAKAIIEKAESCWRYITAATSIPTNFSVRPNSLLNAQAVVCETFQSGHKVRSLFGSKCYGFLPKRLLYQRSGKITVQNQRLGGAYGGKALALSVFIG